MDYTEGVTVRIWNPYALVPPDVDWQSMATDFNFGGHLGFSASLAIQTSTTGTAPGAPWSWQLKAHIIVNNGHGSSSTGDVVLASGTESGATLYKDVSTTCAGTFSASVSTDKLWAITETAYSSTSAPTRCPPTTAYRWYEMTTSGATASCSLTANSGGVSVSAAAISRQTANYKATLGASGYSVGPATHSFGVSNVKVNGISVHDITHSHTWYAQSATEWSYSLTGDIDAFGIYQGASGTISTTSCLDRQCAISGVIRAWDGAYPDSLNITIQGFDGSSRTVGATGGAWSGSDTFVDYSTTTTLTDPTEGSNALTTSAYDVPASISASIVGASLTTNGDSPTDTRVLFRGWRFAGWSLTMASTYAVSGTGNDRAFAPRQGLSTYRYLDVQVKAQTTAPASGVIEVTDYKGTTKTYNVTATATTYNTVTVDLCSPASWSVSALPSTDGKDDPYPRVNTGSTSYAGSESTDSAYWGITSTSRVRVLSGAIDIGTTTLKATLTDHTYVPSSMTYAPERVTPAIVSGDGTTTWYYTRRFWQLDNDGRTEEEGDIWWQKTVGGITGVTSYAVQLLTISELATQVGISDAGVVRHPGCTATSTVPFPGAGTCSVSQPPLRDCYLNGTTGYAVWLYGGGALASPNTPSGTQWAYPHKVGAGAVTAQTQFDSINGDFPPDLFDPFDINGGTDGALYLAGASLLRGIGHGFGLTNAGAPLTTATYNLLLTSTSANRGTDSTIDAAGRYYTGVPWGLGESNHQLQLSTSSIGINPLRTSKRHKGVFRDVTLGGACTAADVAGDQTATYGVIDASNNVQLYHATGPSGTNWVNYTPGITDAVCLSLAYNRAMGDILIIDVDHTDGTCKRYQSTDRGLTVSVATTLGTGAHAAVCVNSNGIEYHFWRTSAGAIQRLKRDPQGNTILAASNVVASGVGDDEIAAFFRLGIVYIIYTSTAGAITMVSSTDDATTFS
jgi:hypothetical protein